MGWRRGCGVPQQRLALRADFLERTIRAAVFDDRARFDALHADGKGEFNDELRRFFEQAPSPERRHHRKAPLGELKLSSARSWKSPIGCCKSLGTTTKQTPFADSP